MDAIVECACCHRQERWSSEGEGPPRVAVLVEGGTRRPRGNPLRGRAEIALACAADPRRRVVGECPACGQLLVSESTELQPIPVEVETPMGRLRVAEDGIVGPDGPLDVAAARDLVGRAWAAEDWRVERDAMLRAPLAASMFVLVGAWILALAFVWFFLGSVLQGTPGVSSP